jgi:hypothetical protein
MPRRTMLHLALGLVVKLNGERNQYLGKKGRERKAPAGLSVLVEDLIEVLGSRG